MSASARNSIDFLPREDWEKTAFGKILKWILSVGRYIVIVTEFIVIVAFLSRFKLDRELTDLNEAIKRKQTIIASYSQFEDKYRQLQSHLDFIAKLEGDQLKAREMLSKVSDLTPIDVYLTDFSSDKQTLTLSATALSEGGLATFIRNLKTSGNFSRIALSKISSGINKDVGIKFQLRMDYSQSKAKI